MVAAMPLFVTFVIILIVINIINTRIKRDSLQQRIIDFTDCDNIVFKVSNYIYLTILAGVILSMLPFGIGYHVYRIEGIIDAVVLSVWMFGALLLIVSINVYFVYSKTYILIKDETVFFYKGKKLKESFFLKDIKIMHIANGFISINTGDKYNKAIPIYFKNMAKFVAILEFYSLDNRRKY